MKPVSVVVPAFNEERSVGPVVRRLREVLEKSEIEHEIIVVDDGSGDATADQAADAGARVIRNPSNKGYGYSLLRGIEAATHELVAITDADGTYPAEALPEMVGASDRFDMVIGRRTGTFYQGGWVKRFSRPVFRWLAEFTSGTRIPDINSGLRVMRRDFVLRHRPAISTGYSFTTTVTLIALLEGCHLLYLPIPYHQRVGSSKVRWTRDVLRSLQIITEVILYYNPLKFFLLLAGLCLLVAGGQVLVNGLAALEWVPRWPAAAVFQLLAGAHWAILVFALGGVGFIIAAASRRRG